MAKPLEAAAEHRREEHLVHAILVAVLAVTFIILLVLGRGMVMDGLVHSPALATPAAQAAPAAGSHPPAPASTHL